METLTITYFCILVIFYPMHIWDLDQFWNAEQVLELTSCQMDIS